MNFDSKFLILNKLKIVKLKKKQLNDSKYEIVASFVFTVDCSKSEEYGKEYICFCVNKKIRITRPKNLFQE